MLLSCAIVVTPRTTMVAAVAAALHGAVPLVAVCDPVAAQLMLQQIQHALLIVDVDRIDAQTASLLLGVHARHARNAVLLVVPPAFDSALLDFVAPVPVQGLLAKPVDVAGASARIRHLLRERGGCLEGRVIVTERVGKALNYIAAHVSEPLTIDGIARAIGTSRSRLAHLFQSELSTTVAGLVVSVRTEVVKFLLLTTEEKLEHIAELAGFCDGSHLSRVLWKVTGVRPSEYRRNPLGASLASGAGDHGGTTPRSASRIRPPSQPEAV